MLFDQGCRRDRETPLPVTSILCETFLVYIKCHAGGTVKEVCIPDTLHLFFIGELFPIE